MQELGLREEAGLPEGNSHSPEKSSKDLSWNQTPRPFLLFTDSGGDNHGTTGPKIAALQVMGATKAQDHSIPNFPMYLIGDVRDNTLAAVPLASMTLLALVV